MRAMRPHIAVPGDNLESIHAGGWELRPNLMARSGKCMGLTSRLAVWRFGIGANSEAANAFSVQLPADFPGFLWVLATRKTGKVLATFEGFAMELPAEFRHVIED